MALFLEFRLAIELRMFVQAVERKTLQLYRLTFWFTVFGYLTATACFDGELQATVNYCVLIICGLRPSVQEGRTALIYSSVNCF